MEDDNTGNDHGDTSGNLPPVATKKQTRKQRSKANESSQQTNKNKKHTLWRNFKALSRSRQLELCLLGLVAIGGIGYLVAYIRVSIWQGIQTKTAIGIEFAPLVLHNRPAGGPSFRCWLKPYGVRVPRPCMVCKGGYDAADTIGGSLSVSVVPALHKERVQSHDMLYKTSRDILYTPRAGSTGTERL